MLFLIFVLTYFTYYTTALLCFAPPGLEKNVCVKPGPMRSGYATYNITVLHNLDSGICCMYRKKMTSLDTDNPSWGFGDCGKGSFTFHKKWGTTLQEEVINDPAIWCNSYSQNVTFEWDVYRSWDWEHKPVRD